MKITLCTAFFALAATLLWTACSKSSSNNTNNSRTTLLTTGAWKYDTAGIDLDHNGTVDLADTTIRACYKDNTYQFKKDSTGIADNGALKCDVSDAQTVNFDWSYTNTEQTALKSSADPRLEQGVTIYSLTSDKFVLYKDTTILGVKIWYIFSLKH